MRNLQEQGNAQFKEGRYPSAIRIYETALQICEAHGFEESAVKLHSNAAAVLLKLNDFEAANGHAEQCIALDPEFAKVPVPIVNSSLLMLTIRLILTTTLCYLCLRPSSGMQPHSW